MLDSTMQDVKKDAKCDGNDEDMTTAQHQENVGKKVKKLYHEKHSSVEESIMDQVSQAQLDHFEIIEQENIVKHEENVGCKISSALRESVVKKDRNRASFIEDLETQGMNYNEAGRNTGNYSNVASTENESESEKEFPISVRGKSN